MLYGMNQSSFVFKSTSELGLNWTLSTPNMMQPKLHMEELLENFYVLGSRSFRCGRIQGNAAKKAKISPRKSAKEAPEKPRKMFKIWAKNWTQIHVKTGPKSLSKQGQTQLQLGSARPRPGPNQTQSGLQTGLQWGQLAAQSEGPMWGPRSMLSCL